MRYRTKPVEIEAFAYHGPLTLEEMRVEWGEPFIKSIVGYTADELLLSTLEGVLTAQVGDYIIKGLRGEFYSSKPDVFNMKYERV